MIKSFVISPRGEMCNGTYEKMSDSAIIAECSMVAKNIGYPIRIEWGDNRRDYVCTHRSEEELDLRKQIRHAESSVQLQTSILASTQSRQSRAKVKKKLNRYRKELRRLTKKYDELRQKSRVYFTEEHRE